MIVVAIIAIHARLTLGTMDYVSRKGAQSRAEAEVVAIESYKFDTGAYRANNNIIHEKNGGAPGISTLEIYLKSGPAPTQ